MRLLLSLFITLNFSLLFTQKMDPSVIDQWVNEELLSALREHRELVSIPNDAAFPEDIKKNIAFLKPAFERRGFSVQLLNPEGIPVLFAEKKD